MAPKQALTQNRVMSMLFWTEDRPPTLREYPLVLLRAGLIGALFGICLQVVGSLLFVRPLTNAFDVWRFGPIYVATPKSLWYSAYAGCVFYLSFFVCCGLPWGYLRGFLGRFPASAKTAIVALIGSVGATLAFTIASSLVSLITAVHPWKNFWQLLIIEAVIGAGIAIAVGTFKAMRRQIRSAEAALAEKEIRGHALGEAAARAQSFALQAQINPHFFFNTLNTLSALVPIDPDAAQEMIGRLAEMFRYTLACSRAEEVTLTQELAFVENYLQLERARFSDRLRITLPEGNFNDVHLPGLSLQPLVENAIRHGIAKRLEGGEVQVSVHRNGKQCSVDVSNPADCVEPAEFFRAGHALANVRDRLTLYAGDNAAVRVVTSEPGQVRVSLIVPLEHKI